MGQIKGKFIDQASRGKGKGAFKKSFMVYTDDGMGLAKRKTCLKNHFRNGFLPSRVLLEISFYSIR